MNNHTSNKTLNSNYFKFVWTTTDSSTHKTLFQVWLDTHTTTQLRSFLWEWFSFSLWPCLNVISFWSGLNTTHNTFDLKFSLSHGLFVFSLQSLGRFKTNITCHMCRTRHTSMNPPSARQSLLQYQLHSYFGTHI